MIVWHVEVELSGRLDDEQIEQLGESVSSATVMATGEIELRWLVNALDLGAAAAIAQAELADNAVVQQLLAAGAVTGPHRLTVMDDVASASRSEVVGVGEAAALMKITPARFWRLRQDDADFPKPLPGLGVDVWEAASIRHYDATRVKGRPGRPRKNPSA